MKSITDRIRLAESEREINEVLAEGASYEDAKPQTRAKWQKVANKRQEELKGQPTKPKEL